MARLSVLAMLTFAGIVVACVNVAAPTDAPAATPSGPSLTRAPSPSPAAQPTPTAEPTVTPSPTPRRTLAPGETPRPTPIDIGTLLTATLSVANLTGETVTILVEFYNEDGESQGQLDTFEIGPYGSIIQDVLPASYGLTFERGAAEATSCIVTVAEAQELFFTVVGEHVLVIDVAAPDSSDVVFVPDSALCG